ncbi:MAG: serine/threonine-protein kinase, partial [Planctomycetota bacterium]
MDNSLSDSRSATSVIYRCPCGERLSLLVSSGGVCESCGRNVTARMLQHDLAMTVTLDEHDDESEATGTFSFELNSPNGESVGPEEANPDVLIGKMYGHFRLISPIGHGGMGQVYRALDTSLQRYAAVKILRSGIGTDVDPIQPGPCSTEVDKLLQEAVSQARVTHPNVVTIYYVGKQDESPFLAMELVNGDPLSERIKNNSLRFDEIWPISIALADALKVSYEIGMLHGDIKPSNVLMDKSKSIKLSDFGMARDVRDESAVTGGTPNYIAPEVLKGEKPGLQSDIYSLGVTFFEMTFGRLPVELDGRAVADWIAKHESEELVFPDPWPEHLPRSWESILRKMLAKLPEDRYRSYDELIDDLELIEPDNKVVAQVFPRIVAAGVDWITILFMAGLLQISARNDVFASLTSNKQIAAILLGFLQFLPLILYLLVINS